MRWDLTIFKHVTVWRKRTLWWLNLNVGSKNVAFLSTERTSVINQMFSVNLIFLAGSSFRRACITRTINYLTNVGSWKMLARFIPRGFGITPSILKLMKEVNLKRFIMLLTLRNFLKLRRSNKWHFFLMIWLIWSYFLPIFHLLFHLIFLSINHIT